MPDPTLVHASDGHSIAVYAWKASGQPRGVIHWLHGMAEHGARYERLATALNAIGWHLVAHDHRGHGASVSDDELRGHYDDENGWQKVIQDTAMIQAWIREKMPGLPIVLAGHSMGSFIALDYAEQFGAQIDGLLLSGSNYHSNLYYRIMRLPALLERWRRGPRSTSPLIHSLTFGAFAKKIRHAATPFDWLSRDAEEVAKYMADPWCGHDCTVQLWLDLIEAVTRMHRRRAMALLPARLPSLLVAGDSDPMSNQGKGVPALFRQLHKAGLEKLSLFEYAGGRHEILNDRCRDDVTADIIDWLGEQFHVKAPASSQAATA